MLDEVLVQVNTKKNTNTCTHNKEIVLYNCIIDKYDKYVQTQIQFCLKNKK